MSNARNLANLLDPSGDVSTDALDNVPPNTALVDSSDNTVLDTSSGNVVVNGTQTLQFKNYGDANTSTDVDTLLDNGVYYSLNPINGHSSIGYNSMGLVLSSKGMGGTNDSVNVRAAQLVVSDTVEGGTYVRMRQGDVTGWHDWKKLSTDFAYKEGASSLVSSYTFSWHYGNGTGSSLDATSNSNGILINESGYYYAEMWTRAGAAGAMIGLALNDSRGALEGSSDGLWGHDHQNTGGGWTHSKWIGWLNAGTMLTGGTGSNTNLVQLGTNGYTNGMYIWRIQ